MQPTKYGAKPVEIDGLRFASKAEGRRYGELRLLAAAGEIRNLVPHPRFALYAPIFREPVDQGAPPTYVQMCDGQYGPTCEARRIGFYTADFAYETKDGKAVVEDVKSTATKTTAYRLRKRLVEAAYGIEVREVE